MTRLVCADCGEVLDEDLSEAEADEAKEEFLADDERDDHDHDPDEQDDSELSDRHDVEEVEDELEDEFEEKLDEIDNDEEDEEVADEAEQYGGAGGEHANDIEVEVGKERDFPEARWQERRKAGTQLAEIFKDKLRQKRKNKTHRERRSGRFDSGRMIQADRGSPRVFKQEDEGDDARYETYLILDRSSSMGTSGIMGPAENAAATLMIGLEEAGVKTELVDFKSRTPRVIKTKSQSAKDEAGNILSGYNSGGTPLSETIQIVADRIEGTDGEPFVIVITDGKPANKENYLETVRELNARDTPVLGVTVGSESKLSEQERQKIFNASVVADETDLIDLQLQNLAREVML